MSADPFARTRALFELPPGVLYLDGNSLGPLTTAARERIKRETEECWGRELIRAWNSAGWIDLPARVGDKIAALIGAPAGSVIAADSTSINLYKALIAALKRNPERRVILSDAGNFPTDLYIAEGVAATLAQGYRLTTTEPEAVEGAIDDGVAVLMLTQVDYRTGRLHDMRRLTELAHARGIVTVWDLAHSAGAMPVDLIGCGVDFAVGCGYKYLNGGPGAPSFIYVRPDLQRETATALSGWMGHEAPFAFDRHYRPAPTIDRLRSGTPSVIAMAALDSALDAFAGVSMAQIRARSIELSEAFRQHIETRCPELALASPRDPLARGSQISFRFAEGYAAIQALIARGVIGDFRAPDIMRFGFTPLYLSVDDVRAAADAVVDVIDQRLWARPEFQARNKVT